MLQILWLSRRSYYAWSADWDQSAPSFPACYNASQPWQSSMSNKRRLTSSTILLFYCPVSSQLHRISILVCLPDLRELKRWHETELMRNDILANELKDRKNYFCCSQIYFVVCEVWKFSDRFADLSWQLSPKGVIYEYYRILTECFKFLSAKAS